MPVPVPVPATRRVLASLPPGPLARVRACALPGTSVEAVTFADLLEKRRDMAGGFVVVDPDGWHVEGVAVLAKRTAENGGRLVLYSGLTPRICRYVKAAVAEAVPEVILRDTDDSSPALRAALRRNIVSVPALVLAGLADPLARLAHPIGSHVTSYLAWAPIPTKVGSFCDAVGLSRKSAVARLHACGLRDTEIVLDAARVARACYHLLDQLKVPDAARLACFGSERTMRDAFARSLGATPSDVRRRWDVNEAAQRLIGAIQSPEG